MGLSHADYRPARRPRRVPTGAPKRKIPLIRVALLIALGVFIAARFDDFWPVLREWTSPAAWKERVFGGDAAEDADASKVAATTNWANDSSRVTISCREGFETACCRALESVDAQLCGAVRATVTKADWKGKLDGMPRTLTLDAHLAGDAFTFEGETWLLTALRGRDTRGDFAFRRAGRTHDWCDPQRGCLGTTAPRAPVEQGRLLSSRDAEGRPVARWSSASSRAVSVLPGRIIGIDTLAGAEDPQSLRVRIRVWHGMELYTRYEPLIPVTSAHEGARVRAGSHLGDLTRTASGRYSLTIQVRQAGSPLDPSLFWEPGEAAVGGLSASASSFHSTGGR